MTAYRKWVVDNDSCICEFGRNLSCVFHIRNAIYTLYRRALKHSYCKHNTAGVFAIVVHMYM